LEDLALIVTTSENDIFHRADNLGVPVRVFETNEKLADYLANTSIDLGVLAWWPNIIKPPLLNIPKLGFLNTHPSLLPHNRGKHYNFWAIVEEAPFGVSIHCVDSGVDSGDIVAQKRIAYDWCDNGGSLYKKAQIEMVTLFREAYPTLRRGELQRHPQDLKSGSFHKASELNTASRIDLDRKYTARELLNHLRARTFEGYPGCWFYDDDNRYEVRIDIRRMEK
jgi:methionyl-tRNA formyltransferase